MTSNGTRQPTVVVVGGGYGEVAVAKALDDHGVKGRDMMIDRYAELLNVPAAAHDD